MKTLNQKKKELFELLVQYYETKPEKKWITGTYQYKGKHCAIGWIRKDFGGYGSTINIVRRFTDNIIGINDGRIRMYQQPTPKQRVIAYLNDEIKKL